ncbi:hypothetical protein ABTZ58_07080 [Streptomyces sp. NPDC094143]|uniref:hypothetical protein n=1 Tax=Streptomyces sp. NPDC094143 TaxID=3155310 RepID=UPI00331F202A
MSQTTAPDGDEPTEEDPPPLPVPDPITFLPAMYYAAVVRDDNTACVNYARTFDVPELYSNAGSPNVVCGRCRQPMTIMSATLLDPQPEVS